MNWPSATIWTDRIRPYLQRMWPRSPAPAVPPAPPILYGMEYGCGTRAVSMVAAELGITLDIR